ncbi:membrane protein [Mesorhizobium sp. L-8-10]|uniref:lysylphosphatidylglycerol synthase domain-containing protein n=1 Tax=unclassified Mesorhizobium TaxID=325217 RepID=UPI001925B222|nr:MULTISPECIES: lysylphosphatidylglycerol synthase domain-containing protein [unclassified Mesorhizobium]BCH26369.1 membrane protein [Mesorhizobium sp. L-8-3]BCH34355.1 membrane protein [Mesorhizobium sp. L-8-10]
MKWKDYVWPAIGLAAVAFSGWLLYGELRGISASDVIAGFQAIPLHRWLLAAGGAVVAYAALAGYDHIALTHLGKRVSWVFVTLCSFTTYALSHNIGGSVASGAVIRYRAYATKGLTGQDVGILVAFCWFTFILATVFLLGVVLVLEPGLTDRFVDIEALPITLSATTGYLCLALVALYVLGSWIGFRPLRIGGVRLDYPSLPNVARQLTIGPIELIGAASIIYFALPEAGNPGFIIVLGVFIIAFSVASATHAPGGIGVFEIVALAGFTDMDTVSVLTALLVFRLFYLIVPLLLALVVVIGFERSQLARRRRPLG